jgi:hypothetical protein
MPENRRTITVLASMTTPESFDIDWPRGQRRIRYKVEQYTFLSPSVCFVGFVAS